MATQDQHQVPNNLVDPAQQSLYTLLDIQPDATKDEIMKAYRQQALKYHPDKSLDDRTEEWMKYLNQAKEILLSDKRPEYDEKLAEEGHVFVCRQPIGYLPEGKYVVIMLLYYSTVRSQETLVVYVSSCSIHKSTRL